MKMDLETLAKIVEERVPTARATCVPEVNQIVVTFTNRPDVEVSLLAPYLQSQLRMGRIGTDDLSELLFTLRRITNS